MSVPAITVELAFGSTYATPAASRTWTDVSVYVLKPESLDTTVGRQDELSTASPNSLRLVFDNSDGRFTPGKASGAYYPNVKIGVPVRVKATPSGQAAATRFVGYVDEWPLAWPGVKGSFAVSAIQATSRLARLGLSTKLRSIIEQEYLLDGPAAYYTLGEAEGATFASDTSGNGESSLGQSPSGTAVVFGTATGPGTDSLTAATFAGGKHLRATLSGTVDTLECFFLRNGNPADAEAILTLDDGTPDGIVTLGIDVDGVLVIFKEAGGGILGDPVAGLPNVADNKVHHVAWKPSTGRVLLDGALRDTANANILASGSVVRVAGARIAASASLAPGKTLNGMVAHVAVFSTLPSDTRIAAHADAGLNGFAGETPAARLARYAAYAGIATAEQSLETGETTMAHLDTTGSAVVDMMRKVETTEAGVLFDGPDGNLTFHDRAHRYGAAAAFTFNVASGNVQPDYAPKLDRSALINLAQVTNADRTVDVVAEDADSRDTYGDHERTIEVASTNVDEPSRRADWEVGIHGEPGTRVPSLTVELGKFTAANQSSILGLSVGARVDVSNLMTQAPNSTESFFVEGWNEHVGPGEHRVTFNVSPAAAYLNVWILGDATYGVLGSTTRLAL